MKALRSNFENIWLDVDKFVYGITGSYDSNPMKGQNSYQNVEICCITFTLIIEISGQLEIECHANL